MKKTLTALAVAASLVSTPSFSSDVVLKVKSEIVMNNGDILDTWTYERDRYWLIRHKEYLKDAQTYICTFRIKALGILTIFCHTNLFEP